MSAYLLLVIFPAVAWLILISSVRYERTFRWLTFILYSINLILVGLLFWLKSIGISRLAFLNFQGNIFNLAFEFSPLDFLILASITVLHLVYFSISSEHDDFNIVSTYGIVLLGCASIMVGLAEWRLTGPLFLLITLLMSEVLFRTNFPKRERTRFTFIYLLSGLLVLLLFYLRSSDVFRLIQSNPWMDFFIGIVIIALFSLFPIHLWIYSVWEKPVEFGYVFIVMSTLGVFWFDAITTIPLASFFEPNSMNVFQILIAVNLIYVGFLGVFNSGWDQFLIGIVIFDLVRLVILSVEWGTGPQYLGHSLFRIILIMSLMWLNKKQPKQDDELDREEDVQLTAVNRLWKYLVGFALIGMPLTPGFGSLVKFLVAVSGSGLLLIISILSFLALGVGLLRLLYSEILTRGKTDLGGFLMTANQKLCFTVFLIWGMFDIISVTVITGIFQ